MKEKFAMVRSNSDGTYDFIPGIEGMDQTIPDEKVEEYTKFWDRKNERTDIPLNQLLERITIFFLEI